MEPAEYLRMVEVQDRHWWFEAKRRTVASLLSRHGVGSAVGADATAEGVGPQDPPRVLEVGPGTGSMIDVMTRYGRMYAADAYLPALRLLRTHRPADAADVVAANADLLELPFSGASFALVGCFDVLYHRNVDDVADAIAELHRVCRPGGHLVITDSAFPVLRSAHDVATHAARRFRLPDLLDPLRRGGFNIEHATYFHALLFPAALAVRLGKRALHGSPRLGNDEGVAAHSDLAPVAGWLNRLLLGLYRVESPLAVRLRLPFGSSLLVLARRRSS